MAEFAGLDLLQRGDVPDWTDFSWLIEKFRLPEHESKLYAYGALGAEIRDICRDNAKTQDDRKRSVAILLTQALNGMYCKNAGGQNVLRRPGIALRSYGGLGATCAKRGGPILCKPEYLPARLKVKVYDLNGYPWIVLGEWVKRVGKPRSKGTIGMAAHRLACWLMHGNPPGPPGQSEQRYRRRVVCHSCDHRGCVRLRCLRWDTDQNNRADAVQRRGQRCAFSGLLKHEHSIGAEQCRHSTALLELP